MKRRSVAFGNYITGDYGWTVTGIALSAPEQKTNYVDKVGGDGSWDLSTVTTDGIPRYKNRSLTVTMELSAGSRDNRECIINKMVRDLDGQTKQIVLPDRPEYYLVGRIHTAVTYSDLAHAAVTITANVAEAGHAFVQWWIVDGVDYAQADAFTTTFAMPKKDVTVTAVFKEIILPDLYDEA